MSDDVKKCPECGGPVKDAGVWLSGEPRIEAVSDDAKLPIEWQDRIRQVIHDAMGGYLDALSRSETRLRRHIAALLAERDDAERSEGEVRHLLTQILEAIGCDDDDDDPVALAKARMKELDEAQS